MRKKIKFNRLGEKDKVKAKIVFHNSLMNQDDCLNISLDNIAKAVKGNNVDNKTLFKKGQKNGN